jgi:hypothetical protein
MSDDTEQACSLIAKAIAIARRAKNERAGNFLKLANDNLRHPEPRMLYDVLQLPAKERDSIDFGNVYVTTEELSELADISRTTIRTLVNGGYLPQEQRGLYRLHDFFEGWRDYHERPR